jgi:hypothetical protein
MRFMILGDAGNSPPDWKDKILHVRMCVARFGTHWMVNCEK